MNKRSIISILVISMFLTTSLVTANTLYVNEITAIDEDKNLNTTLTTKETKYTPPKSIFSLNFGTKSDLSLDRDITLILEVKSSCYVSNAVIDIRLPSSMISIDGDTIWKGELQKDTTIKIPLKIRLKEEKDYAIYATITDEDNKFGKEHAAYYFSVKNDIIDGCKTPISLYNTVDENTGDICLQSKTATRNKDESLGEDGKGEDLGYFFEGEWKYFDELLNTDAGIKHATVDLFTQNSASQITVIDSFDTPYNQPAGLASITYDDYLFGENVIIFNIDSSSNTLYSISTIQGGFSESIAMPCDNPSSHTAEDASHLWVSDSSTGLMYKTNGETVEKIIGSPNTYPQITNPTGITWDGDYLWVADSDAGEIYQIDPDNSDGNSVDLIKPIAGPSGENYIYGLAWDGEHLWVTDGQDTIYEIDPDLSNPSHCEIVGSYDAPGSGSWGPNGLTWDGYHLWLSDEYEDKIYKLSIGPEPVATTYTDDDGYYQFNGLPSGVNYKAKIYSETNPSSGYDAARVEDSIGCVYTSSTDWIYLNGNKYVESNIQGNFKGSFEIVNNLGDIYGWLEDEVSWSRSKINVLWPGEMGTYFMHIPDFDYISVAPGYEWDRMAQHHEYGHAIMFTAYDDTMPPTGNYCGHWLSMETDPGFALVEGWAEFVQGVVDSNGGAPSGDGWEWATEIIDGETGDIWENSIEMSDESGGAHIAYHHHWSSNSDNECLKYIYQPSYGALWSDVEIIDDNPNSGHCCDIVVDEYDIPHVCYQGGPQGLDLYYAKKGGVWTTEEVHNYGVASDTSIDLDSNGNPHIAFYDCVDDALMYAYKEYGQWHVETVDSHSSGSGVGQYASLEIDSADNPHISYYDTVYNDLKYAKKSGGSWNIETVDSNSCGQYSSISVDENLNPHISYRKSSVVKYATKSGSSWIKETVDDSYNQPVISPTSITVDSEGVPHICYYHNPGSALRYASKRSGSWDIVDVADGVDQYCSIDHLTLPSVYDEELNYPYISYTSQGVLNHAYVFDEELSNPKLESMYWADVEDDDDWDGDIVEGAVAATLWDLYDGVDSSDYPEWSTSHHGDYLSDEYSKIWDVIQYDHPNDIVEFWDDWNDRYGGDIDVYWIFNHQRIDVDIPEIPVLSYSSTSIDFGNIIQGETDFTTFDIWNSGDGTLTYSISENVNWLSVSPDEGSSNGEHDTIGLEMIDTTSLSPGEHQTTITITSNGGDGTITVSVNIIEAEEPELSYSTTSINFWDVAQGENVIATFQIGNSADGTLTYSISENVNWLSVSPDEGSSSGETDTITVYLENTDTLSPGPYETTISIDSNGGTGTITVSVNIIEPAPELSYSTTSIDFENIIQGETASETFEIWNSGEETLDYTIIENVNWLNINPSSGTSNGEHDTITVELINTESLNPGNYETTISITSNGGDGAITVYLTILEYGEFLLIDQPIYDRGFPIRAAFDGNWAGAESFTLTSGTFTRAELYIRKFGTPEFDLVVELREDHPEGTLLDTITIPIDDVPSSWEWTTFDFDDVTAYPGAPGRELFIVIPPAPSGVTTSFGYEWAYAFGDQCPEGSFWFTRDGGSLWRDISMTYEFTFKIYAASS